MQRIGIAFALCIALSVPDAKQALARVAAASTEQTPSRGASTDRLVLRGSESPERFPEWFVFERLFRNVAHHTAEAALLPNSIDRAGLSEGTMKLLKAEAEIHAKREQQLIEALRVAKANGEKRGDKPSDITAALEARDMAYRYEILDARQRLYDRISDEEMLALRLWMARFLVATATVTLSGSAKDRFFLPW